MLLGVMRKGGHVVAPGGGGAVRLCLGWGGSVGGIVALCLIIIHDSVSACPKSLPTRFADFD